MDEQNNKPSTDRRRDTQKKKRQKRIISAIFIVLLAMFSIVGFFGGLLIGEYGYVIQDFFGEINPDDESTEFAKTGDPVLTNKLEYGSPFSVLLVGVDYREADGTRGRSDTMIVVTVNPNTEDVKMVSIPRDTLITLPGTDGTLDKINSTFAYGDIEYLTETVESYLNIPIDLYAIINFEGFADLIDALGGIEVDSDMEFSIMDEMTGERQYIEEGTQMMDGRKALGYVRMRKEDPLGDWGRQQRQRQVIEIMVEELMTFESLANYTDLLDAIGPNLETNLSLSQGYTILNNYIQAASDIDTLEFEGVDNTRHFPHFGLEVYTYEPFYESLGDVQTTLSKHMELEDYENKLDEGYDDNVSGFPFYKDNAGEELDLEEFIDDTYDDASISEYEE